VTVALRRMILVSLTCTLAGCTLGGELSSTGSTPPAVDGARQGVDGLAVGHRLMAAGEYDLALRAYYRAAAEQGINADVLSAIGSADLKLGRLNQAEQILRRAIEEDPTFVPALNNLGVVLMERGSYGEARGIFQTAFELDSGNSDEIRENLRLAIARTADSVYVPPVDEEKPKFNLVRRGQGDFVLLTQL